MSPAPGKDGDPAPASGGRELLQILTGLLVFALLGPLVFGLVLFFGVIATTAVADMIDWFVTGRPFDPATSLVVVSGLMLVVLRFGWVLVYGALLAPPATAGAILGLRRLVLGPAGWRAAVAIGLTVGLVADIGVVGFGWSTLGPLRVSLLAGWVVIGSLAATLVCWRIAGRPLMVSR